MTLVKLAGGRIIDPATGRDGVVGDLYLRDGRIVADPGQARSSIALTI